MSDIVSSIDDVVLCQLKLHHTTTEDLLNHVISELSIECPNVDFNVNGVESRLNVLEYEGKIKSKVIEKQNMFKEKIEWELCQPDTVSNRVWQVLKEASTLEDHIHNIIYIVRRQHHSISIDEINQAVNELKSQGIVYVEKNIVKVTPSEKQFIIMEITS